MSDRHVLTSLTGNAPWSVLCCPKCTPATLPLAANLTHHPIYSWAVALKCHLCDYTWHVCTLCAGQRKPFETTPTLYRHYIRFHHVKIGKGSNRKRSLGEESMDSIIDCQDEYGTNESKAVSFSHFAGLHNANYFYWQHHGGLGAAYLVARSSYHLDDVASKIPPNDVSMHLSIAALVCSITRGQREQLANVLHLVTNAMSNKDVGKDNFITRIPQSAPDLRSLYLVGKDAIIPNLPRPNVTIVSDHAYVSLKDCVADLLGHGLPLDTIRKCSASTVSDINQSSVAQKMYDKACAVHNNIVNVICLYITEWSDGFEPSISTKSNRGSCWIKSVTISPPPSQLHALTHTYPIAIGLESDSHEAVEQLFASELMEFRSGANVTFYHAGQRCNATVHLELFASLQDQPERRSANYLMLGGSTFTARWGLSLDFSAVANAIPSCQHCLSKLFSTNVICNVTNYDCPNCVNWQTDKLHDCLLYSPPKDYPADQLPLTGMLSPINLSYDIIKGAVVVAHECFVRGTWTAKNLRCFLRVHGLNNVAISSILSCAAKCKDKATEGIILDGDGETVAMWKFPAMWERGIELRQHIDVVMHLIFLGVVKTCIQMLHEWMKLRGRNNTFSNYLKGTLESLQLLGLSWCQCVPYKTGKLGGWVSENFLAAARIMTWLYCSIDNIASDTIFVAPDKPQTQWTRPQNCSWLSARGLCTKGKAAELRTRVRDYMRQADGPPALLPQVGGEVTNVHQMLVALKAMVARVMAKEITKRDIEMVDYHIRLFLNRFEAFDKGMRDVKDKPTWISSYNFICLTNIPSMLQEFGPVRNLWEGGGLGEKIIGLLKPHWYGFRKNWHYNLLQKVLQKMAIQRVQTQQSNNCNIKDDAGDSSDEDEVVIIQRSKSKLYHEYADLHAVQHSFANRLPMSIVCLTDDSFGVVLKQNRLMKISCGDYIKDCGGASYHHWYFPADNSGIVTLTDQTIISNYCLLLPKLTTQGMPNADDEAIYTVIDSEWNDINPAKQLRKPNGFLLQHSIT